MEKLLKVAYIGSSEFSVMPLKSLHSNPFIDVRCVITLTDRISGRKNKSIPTPVKTEALRLKNPLMETDVLRDESLISRLRSLDLDFIVVCSFSKMVPGRLLRLPRFFCVNIHPSLLPLYRGAAPINRVLMDGRKYTGISFFKMNKRLDSGKIIFQEKTAIDPGEDCSSLSKRLSELSSIHIGPCLINICNGNYSLKSQDEDLATYAYPVLKSECRIDWSEKAEYIFNKVRGLNGYIPAFTTYSQKRLQVIASDMTDFVPETEARPGTLYSNNKNLYVKCGNGAIRLMRVKPEGRNTMDAGDFAQGYNIISGKSIFN